MKAKYYIIRTVGKYKEVYGVIKESKRTITATIVYSSLNKTNKGKQIRLNRNNISKNLIQFDFTLTFDQ